MIHRKKMKMLVKYIIRLTLKNLVDFIYQFYVLNIWYISTLNFTLNFLNTLKRYSIINIYCKIQNETQPCHLT